MKTTQFPKREPTRNLGEQETGLCQTKLLFNETMPASAYGRATYVGPPAPIVIEKLLPRSENQENVDNSTRSSISFSALSEERLLAAVRLAKRDLRRRHREELHINYLVKSHQDDSLHNTSNVDPQQAAVPPINVKSKAHSSKAKGSQSGASRSLNTPQTPPTRDPGPGALTKGQEPQLSKEIRKLQNQLGVYIQKIEQLTNTGLIMEEALEPDELQRKKIRQQEQAARSARILYVLQQQVKEIQEDLDKLRSQKIGDTKKSLAMGRLAAAHRGAVRAIQVFVNQFPESSDGKVPAHYKDLGQLIRQLCLCSAKVEVDQGSAVPESALDILQKLETLDSALSKKERPQLKQARARSTSPACRKSPHRCVSHAPHAPKGPGPTTRCLGRPRKPAGLKKRAGRRMASQNPGASHRPSDRGQVLRAALQCLVQQGELREEAEPNNPSTKGGPLNPERNLMQDAGFQQPTVSSRLRVNQLPQKDYSVPWIPTSPHSPPRPQRSPQRSRPEPRCLFSPHKPSTSPTKQKVTMELGDHGLSSDKKKQAQNEALRQAWLEKTTIQRLRELNQLSKEEAERIQRLRFEVGSPTQWAERAEQKARERIQPLLDQAQQVGESRNENGPSLRHRLSEQAAERAAESAEQLSEALLEDLLDDAARAAWSVDKDRRLEGAARCGLQAPTLESMLLRMEEMQRDQEDVRRRFVSISYADPLDWDKAQSAGPRWCAPGSRLSSPQPIKLTRPVLRHTSTADIVMEKPVDMGFTSESSLTEDCQDEHQDGSRTTVPGPLERSRGTHISLPDSMLTSIQQYREDHEAYLRLVAHEAVGSFNPWAIADSLAEELMAEALAEVAAEFQDVCEEYAEAVFTSEFLQPIQSPPASVPPLGSQ